MGVSMDLFEQDMGRLLAGLGAVAAPLGLVRRLMENLLAIRHANGKT